MCNKNKLYQAIIAVLMVFSASLFAKTQYPEYEKLKNSANLELTDSMVDLFIKLSTGNPGALNVLAEFAETTSEVDPDTLFPMNLLVFDSVGILGSKIWMLYKDVCKEDIVCVHAVMLSLQLGLESKEKVYHAIENRGDGLDITDVIEVVQKRLPQFAKNKASEKVKPVNKKEDSKKVKLAKKHTPSHIRHITSVGLTAAFVIAIPSVYFFWYR